MREPPLSAPGIRRSPPFHLLILSERLPRPDESAGSGRLLVMLGLLAWTHRVDLWVERDETAGRRALSPARVAEARARLTAAGVRVLPSGFAPLVDALSARRYDAVVFEFHAMAARYAAFVRGRQPSARIVVDSVDLHFVRLASGAAIGAESPRRARRIRDGELAVYRAADALLVASRDDARALAGEPSLPPVHCVPMIVAPRPRSATPRAREALFVAHFDHAPNVDGLRWFVHEVWPRIRAHDGRARLSVVGTHAPREVLEFGARPGIVVHGYVPDTAPYLDRARLAVAPLRYGAGMKGKVTEAMAAGLPVVTTSIGAQGLDAVPGEHLLVGEDASSFAAAVGALLDDPETAARIGLAGQRRVAAICSPAVIAPRLEAMLADTLAAPSRGPAGTRLGPPAALAWSFRRWRLAGRHATLATLRRQARWLTSRA